MATCLGLARTIRIYGVFTVFWAGKSPNVRSYAMCINTVLAKPTLACTHTRVCKQICTCTYIHKCRCCFRLSLYTSPLPFSCPLPPPLPHSARPLAHTHIHYTCMITYTSRCCSKPSLFASPPPFSCPLPPSAPPHSVRPLAHTHTQTHTHTHTIYMHDYTHTPRCCSKLSLYASPPPFSCPLPPSAPPTQFAH